MVKSLLLSVSLLLRFCATYPCTLFPCTLFDARVHEQGLTLARARTLLAIAKGDTANQKELAEELEIETATLVRERFPHVQVIARARGRFADRAPCRLAVRAIARLA